MYSLEVTPKITKELLLSKYSQEHFFEYYLGVPVKKGLFCSPSIIRSDKKPTCAFYKNKKGILKYKDFAGPTFDFVECVMYIFSCSYYKALRIIANDFGFIKDEKIPINPPKIEKFTGNVIEITNGANIQVEIQDFTEKELLWWKGFGISLKTLQKFKVYSIKNLFLNGNYFTSSTETSPIFGYYGGVNKEELEYWRIYMPTKRNYRFMSNWSSIMIQGVKQLPKISDHLIITKSMKDLMTLYEYGLIAISPNSENTMMTEHQIEKMFLKYKKIVMLYDNDLPGVKNANKYHKKYGITCVFIKRKYAKDISDLHKKISQTQFWLVIEELQQILKDENLTNTKHFYIFHGKKEN